MAARVRAPVSMATKQPLTDVESQLTTAVDVLAGSATDQEASLDLIQQAEKATGLEVETALADCAYGGAENRIAFAAAGLRIFPKGTPATQGALFHKGQFLVDLGKKNTGLSAGTRASNPAKAAPT